MSNIKLLNYTALILYITAMIWAACEGKYMESMIWFNCVLWCFAAILPYRTHQPKNANFLITQLGEQDERSTD